jgi:hypothetical protein
LYYQSALVLEIPNERKATKRYFTEPIFRHLSNNFRSTILGFDASTAS